MKNKITNFEIFIRSAEIVRAYMMTLARKEELEVDPVRWRKGGIIDRYIQQRDLITLVKLPSWKELIHCAKNADKKYGALTASLRTLRSLK